MQATPPWVRRCSRLPRGVVIKSGLLRLFNKASLPLEVHTNTKKNTNKNTQTHTTRLGLWQCVQMEQYVLRVVKPKLLDLGPAPGSLPLLLNNNHDLLTYYYFGAGILLLHEAKLSVRGRQGEHAVFAEVNQRGG